MSTGAGYCVISLPNKWVNAIGFDQALRVCAYGPHADGVHTIRISFPTGCRVMTDAATRLLSLSNQLAYRNRTVILDFEEGLSGAMGYLHRIDFFNLLHPSVQCLPEFPADEALSSYRGQNPELVEMRAICPSAPDRTLPRELADALEGVCWARDDHKRLGTAAYTVLAELTDNICRHSETRVDGYAALQTYHGGGNVLLSVSDSGRGIFDTIRPAIQDTPLAQLSDIDLIVYMFNQGISRYGSENGCGLRQCALQALKYQAELRLRLPTACLVLIPEADGYHVQAYAWEDLPLVQGTHVAFAFRLDTAARNLV